MPPFLANLDDGALWLAAVVAGLTALGWLLRKTWRGYRNFDEFMRKADVVLDIAKYEMQHNGGGSIKDAASQLPKIADDVAALKAGAEVLRIGAVDIAKGAAELHTALADHVQQAADIHESQAAQIAALLQDRGAINDVAEALPIVARSTPHECDAPDHDEEG